jgi:hypothetical protein
MTYRTSLYPLNVRDAVMTTTERYAHLSRETLLDAAKAANSASGWLLMPLTPPLGATISLGMGA